MGSSAGQRSSGAKSMLGFPLFGQFRVIHLDMYGLLGPKSKLNEPPSWKKGLRKRNPLLHLASQGAGLSRGGRGVSTFWPILAYLFRYVWVPLGQSLNSMSLHLGKKASESVIPSCIWPPRGRGFQGGGGGFPLFGPFWLICLDMYGFPWAKV